MSRDYSRIIITGRVGQDPKLLELENGKRLAELSVATKSFEDKTLWYKVTLWDRNAENACLYLSRGSSVLVEGRLDIQEWQGKDGRDNFELVIREANVTYLPILGLRTTGVNEIAIAEVSEQV